MNPTTRPAARTPTRATPHWATPYIGRPWAPPGTGLSCWEFARHVLLAHYGLGLPADPDQALHAPGWRRVGLATGGELPAGASDGDVLLLRGTRLHCGVVVRADKRLGLLHADGCLVTAPAGAREGIPTGARAVGQVVWQPLAEAVSGYLRCELWRHHAA